MASNVSALCGTVQQITVDLWVAVSGQRSHSSQKNKRSTKENVGQKNNHVPALSSPQGGALRHDDGVARGSAQT